MARAIWQGNLSFGLVTIPVELYTAVRDNDLDLTMLDRRDHSPIGYKKINKRTGEEVTSDVIVKGYEHEKGEYVILTDEDLKSANPKATQSVDILSFVPAGAIPSQYMVKPYYVIPGKKSARPYALLRETMKRTERVALAKVVIRTKQHMASLSVQDDMLVLELLRYNDEILAADQWELPDSDLKELGITDRELKMAEQLVAGLEEEWNPAAYRDEFHDDLLAMIEERVKAGATATKRALPQEEPEQGGEVIDMMALLKRSVDAMGTKAKPAADKKAPAKAKKAEPEPEEAAPKRKKAASK